MMSQENRNCVRTDAEKGPMHQCQHSAVAREQIKRAGQRSEQRRHDRDVHQIVHLYRRFAHRAPKKTVRPHQQERCENQKHGDILPVPAHIEGNKMLGDC